MTLADRDRLVGLVTRGASGALVLGQSRVCGGSLSRRNVGDPRQRFRPRGPQPLSHSTENPFRQRGEGPPSECSWSGKLCAWAVRNVRRNYLGPRRGIQQPPGPAFRR